MEKNLLKYKALKTKEELSAWVNEQEFLNKIISVVKDNSNGDWVVWYTAPPELIWQFSTKQDPNTWIYATNETYENGKHLERFNWRQIEK